MNKMRIFFLLFMGVLIVLPSCKSKRMTAVEPMPVQEIIHEQAPVAEPVVMADIPVRMERFTFEDRTQEVAHDFFVIVGSYSNPENAERARTILSRQGFAPIILKSETGMNRVCVNSYTVETEARSRVHQIRTTFPEYHDAWLLIRQR